MTLLPPTLFDSHLREGWYSRSWEGCFLLLRSRLVENGVPQEDIVPPGARGSLRADETLILQVANVPPGLFGADSNFGAESRNR